MKRVLVTGAANIGKAGVATIIFKFGQAFDRNIIVYDYLMQRGVPELNYQKAIEAKGGKIYTMPYNCSNPIIIIKWIYQIMKENDYDTLHINSDSAYIAAAYIYAAKKAKIKKIYVHSHCTQIDENNYFRRMIKVILHKAAMPYVCRNTKMYLACSKYAGKWMFGKNNINSINYKTIYNGVEVELYLYNECIREKYRNEMGIDKQYVLGHIGRFSYQKNHEFLVELFSNYQKKNKDSILILVGIGELEELIRKKVKKKGIEDRVFFLGLRKDIPALLSMFDIFVMPSRFEGLPVTMVEAQMADLPCVVSGNISREAQFTDKVMYVDGYDMKSWINAIENYKSVVRIQNADEKRRSLFNIKNAAVELQEILRG